MASAGAGPGLNPKADPLGWLSPVPGAPPFAVSPGHQPPEYVPLTGGFCNGIPYPALQGLVVYEQTSLMPQGSKLHMSPPGLPGWTPSRQYPAVAMGASQAFGTAALAPATTVFNPAGNNWYVRTTGSDSNGGSSPSVLLSGTDGATPANSPYGRNVFTSASATFTNAHLGHWINIVAGGITYLVQVINIVNANTINYRIEAAYYNTTSLIGSNSLTWTLGGAWLTWGMAFGATYAGAAGSGHPNRSSKAAPIAPGDRVYVGAGTYRETLIFSQQGLQGKPINIIGDTTGQYTGDAGEVNLSAWLTNDVTAPSATGVFAATSLHAVNVQNVNFLSSGIAVSLTTSLSWQFINCYLISLVNIPFSWTAPINDQSKGSIFFAAQGGGFLIDSCLLYTPAGQPAVGVGAGGTFNQVGLNPLGSRAFDLNAIIRNSILLTNNTGVSWGSTGAGPAYPGGLRIYNSFIQSAGTGIATTNTPAPADIPLEVHGCIIIASTTGLSTAIGPAIVESYNVILSPTPRTAGVIVGNGSISNAAPLWDMGRELRQTGVLRRHFFSPLLGSYLESFGQQPYAAPGFVIWQQQGIAPSAAVYPTLAPTATDLIGRFRAVPPLNPLATANPIYLATPQPTQPMGPQTSPGAIEVHDVATKDNTTYLASPPSGRILGAGDQEIRIPVDSVQNTISVAMIYDSNYTGPMPSVEIETDYEIGVTYQTASAVAGNAGRWQTVNLPPITPSAAGFIILRIISQDTSGLSHVNFAALTVA